MILEKAPGAPNLKWSSGGRSWLVRIPGLAEASQEKGIKCVLIWRTEAMDRREPKTEKSQNNSYKVSVRGEIPADLVNRISALHAQCVLHARVGRRPPVAKDRIDPYEKSPGEFSTH